jgi:hypothetical protein
MEQILKELLKLKNKMDLDSYTEDILAQGSYYPLAGAFEAMSLYNMYSYATEFKADQYLYPYKLQKRIEIANFKESKPLFSLSNGIYSFKGSLRLEELSDILAVLIKYADIALIVKIMRLTLPILKQIPLNHSFYVSLAVMKFKQIELPTKIGQYYTNDYLAKCSEMPFFKEARLELKKIIALTQLPKKAKSMYFTLPSLYNSISESGMFDYGIISLQCFKIIEITSKDILARIFSDLASEEIYDILPEDLKEIYKRDKFKLEYLEIGKIYVLLKNSQFNDSEISLRIKNYFKDSLSDYISYIVPENINNFRNKPAHGEYIVEEEACKALEILDDFINKALYQLNRSQN